MSNEIKGEAQMRLVLTEEASAYLEALLARQHEQGPVCPQHNTLVNAEGGCDWCDFDERSQHEPTWVARINSRLGFGKALA